MKKYKDLIKQIADLYSAEISTKKIEEQKLIAYDIHEELSCYFSEKRLIEASKRRKNGNK